jgi:hypothetical protein
MVPKMAIPIPKAAIKLPFLAVAGLPKNFNPRMKVTDAIKYINCKIIGFISSF